MEESMHGKALLSLKVKRALFSLMLRTMPRARDVCITPSDIVAFWGVTENK